MESNKENKNMIVDDMILMYHNPKLVKPDESPNGNRVYHIYSDGEITNQKGGFAYLRRSEFTDKSSIHGLTTLFMFPIQRGDSSYAIVTEKDAKNIRQEMVKESIKHLI
jgi:hypothetical protein